MPRAKKGIGRRYKKQRPIDGVAYVPASIADPDVNDASINNENDIAKSFDESSSVDPTVNTMALSPRGGCSTNLSKNHTIVDVRSSSGRCFTNHGVNDNGNLLESTPVSPISLRNFEKDNEMSPNTSVITNVCNPSRTLNVNVMNSDVDSSTDNSVTNDASKSNSIGLLDSHSDADDSHKSNNTKNDGIFRSYDIRRRHVREIKKYIKALKTKEQKVAIVSDLFNDYEILPLLRSAGIVPPNEALANKRLLEQFRKQLIRSSVKDSSRGRINNDLQSYRINAVGMLMDSPMNNDDELKFNKDVFRVISNNNSLPRTSARRLMQKAVTQRQRLSKQDKGITWSIISHRNSYDTKQTKLNASLFDWIINHQHVIASPILKDTVIVKVPNPDGSFRKERVGKLLLEISVRALHQDMMKEPPLGFDGAYCPITKKLIISERHLRNILPPQLKRMSVSQKQMCGCECCTIMKMTHECLLQFRKKQVEVHRNQFRSSIRTRHSSNDSSIYDDYRNEIFNDNCLKFPTPQLVIETITCEHPHTQIPRWECVMGRCKKCPNLSIPYLESIPSSPLSRISYGSYQFQSRCKIHGILNKDNAACPQCELLMQKKIIEVPEKIFKRKEIVHDECSINDFHTNIYIPMLRKFKYHLALVIILSKNYCKKMRQEAFLKHEDWFLSERDYAERLVKELDGEIQSEHFGDNATLSIEGCTLQYHKKAIVTNDMLDNSIVKMDFHSHFSDHSRQDAATTFEHMCVMLDNHRDKHGPFSRKCVILDHTDGCAKQYRSGNALYLLNIVALKYNITIDRAVCAPGHGKSIIDGMNAVDKHYLRQIMDISGTTRTDNVETRMSIFSKRNKSEVSFAKECARLCSLNRRKYGVLNSAPYNARKQKLSERFYHIQEHSDVRYAGISKGTKGWKNVKNQSGNGMQHYYNFRADPALGKDLIACRRIPCACNSCIQQLKEPWIPHLSYDKQPRYKPNDSSCILWNVLGEYNNWIIISIIDRSPNTKMSTTNIDNSVFESAIHSRSLAMSSVIEVGNYAAISTTDIKAVSGYYVCVITSNPYSLPESFSNGSEQIPAGEIVCDVTWLNPVPHCRTMFSHGMKDEIHLHSKVRVQHVVDEKVTFSKLTSANNLPKSMRSTFKALLSKNTIIIDDECHDEIIETIHTLNHLDFEEYFYSSEDIIDSDEDSLFDDVV